MRRSIEVFLSALPRLPYVTLPDVMHPAVVMTVSRPRLPIESTTARSFSISPMSASRHSIRLKL